MFTDEVVEIDLDTNLKKERYDPGEQIYIFVPRPYGYSMFFNIRRVPSRFYGERRYFICRYCKKNKLKLYTLKNVSEPGPIACRQCYGLKYDSQYGPQTSRDNLRRAVDRMYDKICSKTIYYNGELTRHGRQLEKLEAKVELRKKEHKESLERMLEKFRRIRTTW